ncbi:MAG: orotate phosphoribosyltransferase [Methanobacteriota archaeon]|jgi:orotate phosphoribosyltransferase|uniref:Orotate phosphoribosyltransferase n=1 Tax=Halorutilus salinus TaxID=2487751 RepID=A0A9Q4GG48_9EURY|nr:orotate phosphoribosyltransferase [Halorutilus salinus]MCX2818794.1 orotate phosphoribosyltransferase [Halorutilus salinus]
MVTEKQVADALRDADAVLRGEFELSSGRTSDYYVDKYVFETQPDALRVVGSAIAEKVTETDADRIGAVALGGVPLAAVASAESGVPYVIARKEEKGYGTANAVEGELEEGDRVVVVEDIVTTGASAVEAVEKLRDAGATVDEVIVVVDRQEGGRERVEEAGLRMHALTTAEELV